MNRIGRYRVPDDTEVISALSHLGKLPLRQAFYSTLKNPNWVSPLLEHGAFENPPETTVTPDGLAQSDHWPEIDYLIRMAPMASSEVTEVFTGIVESDNQWVRRGIMKAASKLTPADAAKLVPFIKEWPSDRLANFRIHPKHVERLIITLLEGGQHPAGFQLANAYFEPQAAGLTAKFGPTDPIAGLEPHWYAESLPAVARALGTSRIPTLLRWLRKYQERSRPDIGKPHYDISHIWRASIREPERPGAHDMGNALVDVAREWLIDEVKSSGNRLPGLLEDEEPLLRRLALDVLAAAIDEIEDKSSNRPLAGREECLAEAAARVFRDETFFEGAFYGEYMPFLRACLAWRRGVGPEIIIGAIEAGPPATRDERRERFAGEGESPSEVDAKAERYKRRWQQGILSSLDADLLPEQLSSLLAELDAEFGPHEVGGLFTRGGSFVGPASPMDAEGLRSMSDDDLIHHLLCWHPDPGQWVGPSHEGHGQALAEAVSSEPGRLADRIGDLQGLRPIYIRGVVRGWKAAVEAGNTLPWKQILSLCEWVVGLSEDVEFIPEGRHFDDDSDYRPLKLDVLQFLGSALGAKPGIATKGIERLVSTQVVYEPLGHLRT